MWHFVIHTSVPLASLDIYFFYSFMKRYYSIKRITANFTLLNYDWKPSNNVKSIVPNMYVYIIIIYVILFMHNLFL